MLQDFHARIPVCKKGYHWWAACIGNGPDKADFLQVNAGDAEYYAGQGASDEHFRFYNPFDNPALFQLFAELDVEDCKNNRETIERFTSEFGEIAPEWRTSKSLEQHFPREVLRMRVAIRLWRAIQDQDAAVLGEFIQWHKLNFPREDDQVMTRSTDPLVKELTAFGWSESEMFDPDGFVRRTFGQNGPFYGWGVVDTPLRNPQSENIPRRWCGRKNTEKEMVKCAAELLDDTVSFHTDGGMKTHIARSPNGALTIQTEPTSLRVALWLQLASAVADNKQFPRCKYCEKPFYVGPNQFGRAAPRDKLFCTVTCRVKAFQKRQAVARQMRAEGHKLSEIAKAVESDVKTVKGWLSKK